jgi:ankyrin repeat protein
MKGLLFLLSFIIGSAQAAQVVPNKEPIWGKADPHNPHNNSYNKKKLKKSLRQGRPIDEPNMRGTTGEGDVAMVQQLLVQGADKDAQDKAGFTALMASASQKKAPLFQRKQCALVLLNASANPYIKSYDAKTILAELEALEVPGTRVIHDKEQISDHLANKVFAQNPNSTSQAIVIDPSFIADPDIKKALQQYEFRAQQEKKILLNETPLPQVLIDMVAEYAGVAPIETPTQDRCIVS